jgi:transposase
MSQWFRRHPQTAADYAGRFVCLVVRDARHMKVAVPGESLIAESVRELAAEALATKARLSQLDRELTALLDRHRDALIRSLPGIGPTLTPEFLAEAGSLKRLTFAN